MKNLQVEESISVENISADKFPNICRTCLGSKDIRPIFNIVYEGIHVQELLLMCVSLQVQQDDNLPKNICLECLENLLRNFCFKKMCQQSETTLRNIWLKSTKEITKNAEPPPYSIIDHEVFFDNNDKAVIVKEENGKENTSLLHLQTNLDENTYDSFARKDTNSPDQEFSIQLLDNQNDDVCDNNLSQEIARKGEYILHFTIETFIDNNLEDVNIKKVIVQEINIPENTSLLRLQTNVDENISDSFAEKDRDNSVIQENPIEASDNQSDDVCDNNFLKNVPQLPENLCTSESIPQYNTEKKVKIRRKKQTDRKKEKYFACKECPKVYSRNIYLKKHMWVHTGERPFMCEICGKGFRKCLTTHMRTHTKEKPYTCHVCSMAFSIKSNLQRHIMTHTGERPYVCDICNKGFIQHQELIAHKYYHLGQKPYVCKDCGKGYTTSTALSKHRCFNKKSQSEIQRNNKIGDQQLKKNNQCNVCGRCFAARTSLQVHLKVHEEKAFLCNECGMRFHRKEGLHMHQRVHNGIKPFTCSTCYKTFSQSGGLKQHEVIHSGQRPFSCEICGKTFTQRSHLMYHVRLHTGEKAYVCPFCNKAFTLKGNLTVHIRTHTGESPYVCDLCGRGFYDSSSMKKHRRKHEEVKFEQKMKQ